MRVALFGAAGQLGRRVLRSFLDRDHEVRVLVRSIQKLTEDLPDNQIIEGDARNPVDISRTISKADVIVSTLGMKDISKPESDLSDGLKAILAELRGTGGPRIIAVGGASVLPHPDGGLRKNHDLPDYLIHVSMEHERQWQALSSSGKTWTLVCPTFFNDDLPSSGYRVAREELPQGSDHVMLHDLADFIVLEAERGDYLNCRVGIVSDLPETT